MLKSELWPLCDDVLEMFVAAAIRLAAGSRHLSDKLLTQIQRV